MHNRFEESENAPRFSLSCLVNRCCAGRRRCSACAFDELVAAYQSPGRFYHTFDHVAAVLRTVDLLSHQCRDRFAVRLAAWYHDAIYDSRAGDNEERSADMARVALGRLGFPKDLVERVATLILTTKTHQIGNDPDAAVLLDADLAILGADAERYDQYAGAIRQEYAWVPDDAYKSGRAAILRRFAERAAIFQTPEMQAAYDKAARENLTREIARLTGAR